MTEINKVKEKLKNTLSESDVMEVTRSLNDVRELMTYYQCAIMEVETKFKVLNERFKLSIERNPIDSISSRHKTIDSMSEKLRRKNLPMTAEAIEQYFKKGDGILLEGHLQTGSYMNQVGQKVYTTDVVVDRWEFPASRRSSAGANDAAPEAPAPDAPAVADAPSVDDVNIDDEIPFN